MPIASVTLSVSRGTAMNDGEVLAAASRKPSFGGATRHGIREPIENTSRLGVRGLEARNVQPRCPVPPAWIER